jgi:hypothetical protein
MLALALLPVSTLALAVPDGRTIRIVVLPLPPRRELLLIVTPCNRWRSGAVSAWTASDQGNSFRLLTLPTFPIQRAVLGGGWLIRRLGSVPISPRCA